MDRVKVKTSGSDLSQWIFNTHKVFKWIQDFIENNIKKLVRRLFITAGVFFYNDQTYLKCSSVTINGGKYVIVVEAGHGLTTDGDVISVLSQINDNSNDDPGNSTKYLYLQHILVDDTDVTYEINRLPSSYPDINVHQKDSYVLMLSDAWPVGDDLNSIVKIAKIVQSTGPVIVVTDERIQAQFFNIPAATINWLNDNCTHLTKDGTDADKFLISGARVLTEPTEPPPPLNIRIYDINPVGHAPRSKIAKIYIKWNWEALTGTHYVADGANTIRIEGVKAGDYQELDVTENQLAGFRLYSTSFESTDKTYLIVSNLATTGVAGSKETIITLEEDYNNEAVVENCQVIINGDGLVFEAHPYADGAELEYEMIERQLGAGYVRHQTFAISLPMTLTNKAGVQAYYNIKMRSKMKTFTSEFRVMEAGSYDPDHVGGGQAVVNYGAPFECKLPMLDDTGADLTLTTTVSGFQIEVSGWKVSGDLNQTAHEFEIIRTTLDSVDWNDVDNSIRIRTVDRLIDVPCSFSRLWAVGVRPLQNSQVVGTPVEKTVKSGAMGVAPGDQAVLNGVEIDLRTYSGTLTVVSGKSVGLTAYKSPAGSATDAVLLSMMSYMRNNDCILKDVAGNSFIVNRNSVDLGGGSDILVDLVNLSGESSNPVNGAFEINTTERGRRLKVLNSMQVEMDSVIGYFDSDIITGATVDDPGILRVGQNSVIGKTKADTLAVYENDSAYEFVTNFVIRNSYGNLGLFFDAFDPSLVDPNNRACIRGRFTLYMVPHTLLIKPGETRNIL
ncbi:MAG TPA: hypothetical protein ENN45_02665 [Bacteroidetes bacterium]|nr:hypothetical protein [Bacteroidota bacterium]